MIRVQSAGRPCDGCTKCCEGWLTGEAYGYDFSPGKKCIFLNKGCTIYPVRPDDPCKVFRCQWKINRSLPEWLKPDVSGVIVVKKTIEEFQYLHCVPTGVRVSDQVHTWAENYSMEHERNHIVVNDPLNVRVFSKNNIFKNLIRKYYKI